MAGLDDWLLAARAANPDDLRERILTGYKSGKPFTPYVPTIALPAGVESVLDFGCGLGRNFPYLKTIARRVTGFDLPPMIERCRALAPVPADVLTGDWQDLRQGTFDLIVATLVLQHIETEACAAFLADFAAMTPAAYVLTRTDSDFGANVLDIIAATGLFETGECVEVDHDPATHGLRVLGRRTFDEVRRSGGGGHYEMVLRSRQWSERL